MAKPRDIVCISTNYWGGEWFRKQQFMSRFSADGHRVLYVEPSYSLVRGRGGRAYIRNRPLSTSLTQHQNGLWVLTPRTLLPGASRPVVSQLNALRLARSTAAACRRLGFEQPLLWVYPPEYAPALGVVEHSAIVVDLVDDLVAYEVIETRKRYVRRCTEELMSAADAVVCTTPGLAEEYSPGAAVVPNGFDASLFDPATQPAEELEASGRVVGFIGTLFRYLDYRLMEEVATRVPDVTVVLVGRLADDDPDLLRLLDLPNVRHIPPVPRDRVPEFVAAFDVCMVPFRVDDVSRNVSPLKAYEYLAMRKPVVSVDMPALEADPAAAGTVYAQTREAFVAAVKAALDDGVTVAGGGEAVCAASWDGRYAAVRDAVGPLLESDAR